MGLPVMVIGLVALMLYIVFLAPDFENRRP